MKISLKGKKALVGGSSGGIGKAIAQQLAASGASVTIMARNEGKLKSVLESLSTSEEQSHQYLVVDFSDYERYKKVILDYFEKNSVHILVNNTQGPSAGSAVEKNVEDYQEAFNLLFKTVVFTTELALPKMMHKEWGRVINVASISVKEPLSYLALSNSIRASLVTWAKSLATDVGEKNITVNSVLTGYFDTERIAQLNAKKAQQLGIPKEEVLADMKSKVPLKRIGDHAAFITGTQIPIDGGLLKSL